MTRERLPNRRSAERFEFTAGNVRYTAQIGSYPDGRIGEVFLNAGKIGTELDVIARDSAIAVSFALQHGATAEDPIGLHAETGRRSAEGPLGALFDLLPRPKSGRGMIGAHVLTKALGGRWCGSYGLARCPTHDDRETIAQDARRRQ